MNKLICSLALVGAFSLFLSKIAAQSSTDSPSVKITGKGFANPPLSTFSDESAARTAFEKSLHDGNDGDKTWANVGLAQYWLAQDSLERAFVHADTAAKMFTELNDKRQEKLQSQQKVTLPKIRNLVAQIVESAYEQAKSEGDFVAWDVFLTHFPKPVYVSSVNKFYTEGSKNRADQLCFRLKKLDDADALLALLQRYEADLRRQNPDCRKAAFARQLAMSFRGRSWRELDAFFKQNPKHPLHLDAARKPFVEAILSSDAGKMRMFAMQNAESPFAAIALDSAAFYAFADVRRRGNFLDMMRFYRQFPASSRTAEIDAYFSDFIEKTSQVLLFRRENQPNFGLQNLPKTEIALYNFYKNYGTTWAIDQFLDNHEGISNDIKAAAERDRAVFKLADDAAQTDIFIQKAATTAAGFKALQGLISDDIKTKRFEKAAATVHRYATFFPKEDKRLTSLLEILERPLSNVTTEKLSSAINSTDFAEYSPVISMDNRTLYFCRRTSQEDVYVSRRNADGSWAAAEICKGLDSPSNEAPMGISADGTRLLLFREGKLFFTEKNKGGSWSAGKSVSPNVNASVWQAESSLSADGRVLVFESRRRDDVIGLKESSAPTGVDYKSENIDLYISFRISDSTWSPALNLGTTLNTPFRERSPFLHPDGRTLYFCSEGHGGLGGLDLFKTTRLDSTWLNWSTPVHVGKELNTTGDDWGFKISTNGRYAYYSSNNDIWLATPLPDIARPLPTRVVTGRLVDFNDKAVTDVRIIVRNKIKGDTLTILRPDPTTGEYAVVVPADGDYEAVVVNRKTDYLPMSVNLTTPSVSGDLETKDDIKLIKKDDVSGKGVSFTFRNLNFAFGKADIQAESFSELDRWAEVLQGYKFKARIEGHTDNVGDDERNLQLSQRRAEAARAYLIGKNCNPNDIEAVGLGKRQPIGDNKTEDGRAMNRRVEIQIRKE